ncbi:MAG: DUF5665 domain-containing protein [Bacillota bacterium]
MSGSKGSAEDCLLGEDSLAQSRCNEEGVCAQTSEGSANFRDAAVAVRSLQDTLQSVSDSLERAKIAEYVGLLNRPGRLIFLNTISGLFRGLGMAAGFTILGALLIYVLTRSFIQNLPIVGNFLGEIVWIIQQYLKGK